MKWIFLSPHLDDVVFSCGGFIWDLTTQDDFVEIWTICAADPPAEGISDFAASLHKDWGLTNNPYQVRREEDQVACQILGAKTRYLDFLDGIYRYSSPGDFYYDSEAAIFGGLDERELTLIDHLVEELETEISPDVRVVAPLGIGNHVDHELVRKAANRLTRSTYYYADYPYAREDDGKQILRFLERSSDWSTEVFSVSDDGSTKWYQAAKAYTSQIPVFWKDDAHLQREIREFTTFLGGIKLWKTVPED